MPIENETEMWPMKLGRWILDSALLGNMSRFPISNELLHLKVTEESVESHQVVSWTLNLIIDRPGPFTSERLSVIKVK